MDLVTSVSPRITDLLQQAGAVGAAAQSGVHIISMGAIRDAVGDRWARHGALVEDFVYRSFRRGAHGDDAILRINDTDFVLIQPHRDPLAALSRASILMRETLSYFLGAVKPEDIVVALVEQMSAGGLRATPITQEELTAASQSVRDLRDSEDGSPPWEVFGVATEPRKAVRITRPDGSTLHAAFFLSPVWQVAKKGVASFLLSTVAVEAVSDGTHRPVDPHDMTARCHAALGLRRSQFLREVAASNGAAGGASVVFHLPISYNALAHSSARAAVLADLKRLDEAGLKTRIFIELTETPEALPQGRLSEIVAQLRPFTRGVFIRLLPDPGEFRRWAHCGAVGVLLPVDPCCPERSQLARFDAFTRQCQQLGLAAFIDGARTRSLVIGAWASGATLLAGDAVATGFGADIEARRFLAEDFYAD